MTDGFVELSFLGQIPPRMPTLSNRTRRAVWKQNEESRTAAAERSVYANLT